MRGGDEEIGPKNGRSNLTSAAPTTIVLQVGVDIFDDFESKGENALDGIHAVLRAYVDENR